MFKTFTAPKIEYVECTISLDPVEESQNEPPYLFGLNIFISLSQLYKHNTYMLTLQAMGLEWKLTAYKLFFLNLSLSFLYCLVSGL